MDKTEIKEKRIKKIMDKTGWSYELSLERMDLAKNQFHIKNSEYIKYHLYDTEDVETAYAKRKALAEKREERIQRVMAKTGWEHSYAKERMQEAKKQFGINFKEYIKYHLYDTEDVETAYAKRKALAEKREERIQRVMAKTGWEHSYAKERMQEAKKQFGINFKEYIKYHLYDTEDVETAYAKRKKQFEQQEAHVQKVMEKTNWDHAYAKKQMLEAKKNCGITFKEYVANDFYTVLLEDQQRVYYYIQLRKQCMSNLRKQRRLKVMKKMGWTEEEMDYELGKAKQEFGLDGPLSFLNYGLCNVDRENWASVYLREKEESTEAKKQEYEELISKIMKASSWPREKVEEEFAKDEKKYHCLLIEYFIYRFYELTEEEKDALFLVYYSRMISGKYDTDADFAVLISDKEETNVFFNEYVRRPWCVNTKVDLDTFKERFKNSDKIMYKPISGHMGLGITSYQIHEDNIIDIYHELKKLPAGVVEEYVKQHKEMNALVSTSVNTLRIVTVSSNTKPVCEGKMFDFAYAGVRVGGGNIVDNFHSGGMVAGVDLETGIVMTDAANMNGEFFEKHPITSTTFKGFKIPYFDEAKAMIQEAVVKNKIEGFLGWDIAISEDGPLLIELNTIPGADILSTPYAKEHKGQRYRMMKYI